MSPPQMDVQAIVIGLDHRARKTVQDGMRAIAERGDSGTKAGLVRMLRDATAVVVQAEPSWMYGHAEGGPLRDPSAARAQFLELAQRARSRFPVEVIRNAYGKTERQPSPAQPASEEPGVVLVTLIVAARRAIPDVDDATRRASLRAGLEALATIGEQELVALEVIWSPADEADRVAPAQLEQRHPEIRRITS